jgi:hypothetical protein
VYLLTEIGLSAGGRSTVHIYTQTVQQYNTHLHTNSTAVQYTFTHKQYSSTVHIYTQTVQQYSTHLHTNHTHTHTHTHKQYTEQHKNKLKQCGPCPVFASYTLAFALQLRKKARKNFSQGSRTKIFHRPNSETT